MRVALYARVSTRRQAQADGIAQQLDRLRVHALAQGWTVSDEDIFRDDGFSGAHLRRPGLERLRDRAALRVLDRVLITAPDRLGTGWPATTCIRCSCSRRSPLRAARSSSSTGP